MPTINSFDIDYARALNIIMAARPDINKRTGKRVRAVHGIVFHGRQTDRGGLFPILSLRDIRPLWACAEAVWFLSGSKDPKWMEHFGFKAWSKFTDFDGSVHSATGWRWRNWFGVDQLNALINKLENDVSSRQCVLQSWDPKTDLLNPGPNVPCLVSWHLHTIDNKLNLSVFQRSADMFFGLPHDILGARIIQELIAARLHLHVGSIMYAISNAHLYEDQWEAAEEMMARADGISEYMDPILDLNLLHPDFDRALEGDLTLPMEIAARINRFYDPFPSIAGPQIAL